MEQNNEIVFCYVLCVTCYVKFIYSINTIILFLISQYNVAGFTFLLTNADYCNTLHAGH